MDLFGGQLTITDAFSSTFSKFTSGLSSATGGFANFATQIGKAERANRLSMRNMERDIQELAKEYEKQGYTMSQALKKATSEINKRDYMKVDSWAGAFGKIKQSGVDAFDGISSKIQSFSDSTLGTITKLTAGFASFEGIKKGFEIGIETGSEYQNLRLVLDNLYKNSSKGSSQFQMATNFAANSIWQEKDVVRSLARLKGYGLNDSKQSLTEMSDLGSFAKAMGVGDINSATQAYAEMMEGRWQMMMMELGIKREDVEKYAQKNHMQTFDDKNGHITNKSVLETAFKGLMDERGLTGLTEKMKNTFTGRMSTLKDNIQKSFAEFIGVAGDGTVRAGSIFDKLENGISKFTKKIQEASENGKLDKITNELDKVGSALESGFSYILDHPEVIEDFLKFGVALWTLGKVASIVSAFEAFGTILALPFVPEILAIAGAIFTANKFLEEVWGENYLSESIQGWGMFFDWFGGKVEDFLKMIGIDIGDDKKDTISTNSNNWYGGKDGHTLMTDSNYPTISGALASGQVTKSETNNNNNANNKTEINMNIAKVEKTADVDEVMDTVVKRLTKYQQTRNNIY